MCDSGIDTYSHGSCMVQQFRRVDVIWARWDYVHDR